MVTDGVDAMSYLRRTDGFVDATRPDLILLDLNLPRKSGHEVLAEVKRDPELRRIPVVVLTTSLAQEDVAKSYDLHASVHVSKPVDFDQFTEVVRQIDDFFGNVAELPDWILAGAASAPARGDSRWLAARRSRCASAPRPIRACGSPRRPARPKRIYRVAPAASLDLAGAQALRHPDPRSP